MWTTVESLYCGHPWDRTPLSVLITEVSHISKVGYNIVLIEEVSLHISGVSL